jgi:hypothetical protein
MIRLARPYLALLDALDAMGRANKATDALVHRACSTFATMVAEITGERCVILIGETPIARTHGTHHQRRDRGIAG